MLLLIVIILLSCTNACSKDKPLSAKIDPPTVPAVKDSTPAIPPVVVTPMDTPIVVNPFLTTMDKFMGTNGVHEERIAWLSPIAGTARFYTNRDWFEGDVPGDILRFQNSRSGWYFDDAYTKFKNAGVDIMLCLQFGVKNLYTKNPVEYNDKPLNKPGISTTNPASYTNEASTLGQVAMRYGSKVWPANALRSDDKKSGLNLVKYFEVWNEPNKDWSGKEAEFSPEEYAAMLSVCYDSIKKADPNAIVVMGGTAGIKLDYYKRMNEWFKANRDDKNFAADIINGHDYAFNKGIVWGVTWPLFGPAETPEDYGMYELAKASVDWAKSIGKAFWVSEFGYDTHPQSPLYPKPIAGVDVQELQARYLMRSYLEFAAAGVAMVQQYELVDPSQEQWGGGLYATSGLIKRDGNLNSDIPTRKKSWFAIKEMKETLAGYKFNKIIQRNTEAHIYEFVNGVNKIYAAWLPTSTNASKNITVNGTPITVSEKPVFVKF